MKKIIRILGVVVVVFLLGLAIFTSTNSKVPNSDKIWYTEMTMGNVDAKNYFVVYSDIVCPYCVAFENAIIENKEAFEKYLEENDILFEVRLSDLLYYSANLPNSKFSAEAAYCAKNEGKFWEYYDLAITTVWNDYFKSSGKAGNDEMKTLDKDYWISFGTQIGLGDSFKDCVKNDSTLDEVEQSTTKTSKVASGIPLFKFNEKTLPSNFGLDGTWEDVLALLDLGISK